jgi:ubiquinone/menaquinone biosynthesis C-methylase UbiE
MRNDRSDVREFDKWSRTYERSFLQNFYFDHIHWGVLRLVAHQNDGHVPESILDVGCGTGRLLRKSGQRWPGARLVGVDSALGMIQAARNLTPGASFYTASAESIPMPDASVEVAMSTMSYQYWEDRAAGVREIARVLRPGGRFCLADGTFPALLAKLLHHREGNSFAAWRVIFEQAGLAIAGQERRFLGHVLIMLGVKR